MCCSVTIDPHASRAPHVRLAAHACSWLPVSHACIAFNTHCVGRPIARWGVPVQCCQKSKDVRAVLMAMYISSLYTSLGCSRGRSERRDHNGWQQPRTAACMHGHRTPHQDCAQPATAPGTISMLFISLLCVFRVASCNREHRKFHRVEASNHPYPSQYLQFSCACPTRTPPKFSYARPLDSDSTSNQAAACHMHAVYQPPVLLQGRLQTGTRYSNLELTLRTRV